MQKEDTVPKRIWSRLPNIVVNSNLNDVDKERYLNAHAIVKYEELSDNAKVNLSKLVLTAFNVDLTLRSIGRRQNDGGVGISVPVAIGVALDLSAQVSRRRSHTSQLVYRVSYPINSLSPIGPDQESCKPLPENVWSSLVDVNEGERAVGEAPDWLASTTAFNEILYEVIASLHLGIRQEPMQGQNSMRVFAPRNLQYTEALELVSTDGAGGGVSFLVISASGETSTTREKLHSIAITTVPEDGSPNERRRRTTKLLEDIFRETETTAKDKSKSMLAQTFDALSDQQKAMVTSLRESASQPKSVTIPLESNLADSFYDTIRER